MIQPSLQELKELAGKGSVIPVCKDILGDLLTPAAAFLRVAHGRRRVFLLESVEGGERLAQIFLHRLGSVYCRARQGEFRLD